MKHYMAIDNVCAWPNLTQRPNGEILATIFNQPCHGKWEGDVECWASSDGGVFWKRRGVPAPHEPETNRMNVAAGQAANGDLVVLASGWSDKSVRQKAQAAPFRSEVLPTWICRSTDSGATWALEGELPSAGSRGNPIPFGDILHTPDGNLYATLYAVSERYARTGVALLESGDNGRTWQEKTKIVDDGNHNETTLVHVEGSRWLAAARTANSTSLDLFVSDDNGATWQFDQPLTGPMMAPAHLLRLRNGQILLTYGIRHRGCYGVGARFSEDGGRTWTRRPMVVVQFGTATDGGYPSTVEREDGTLVTAWYANSTTMHARYQMGITHWNPDLS